MTTKYFEIPFANSGDQTSIPNASQPGGDVSFTEGWTPDYEKDQATDPDAKDVSRQGQNYLNFTVTEALKEIQEQGGKPYDPVVNYPIGAIIIGSDNNFYRCLVKTGPGASFLPVVDPVGDLTGTWIHYNPHFTSIVNLRASLITPFAGQVVSILGYSSPGDGGGQPVYWDALSTEADNGISIFKLTDITTGRFKSLSTPILTIKHAGALVDGVTDDSASIQAMQDYMTSLGLKTFFPAGTTVGVLNIDDNAQIEGEGYNSILKLPAASTRGTIASKDVNAGASDFVIKNLLIDGNKSNQSIESTYGINADGECSNFLIEHVKVIETYGHGIQVRGGGIPYGGTVATDFKILNCDFVNAGRADGATNADNREGVYINGGRDFLIDNCRLKASGRQQIALEGSQTDPALSTRYGTITNNILTDGPLGGIDDETVEGGDFIISNNIIKNHPNGAGIRTQGPNGGTIIDGNQIYNANEGVDFQSLNSSAGVYSNAWKIISNNTITDSNSNGIKSAKGDNSTIIGNQIYGSGGIGIHHDGSANNIKIDNNTIIDSESYGILCDSVIDVFSICNNIVLNSGTVGLNRPGIGVTGTSTNGQLNFNTATDTQGTKTQSYGLFMANNDKVVMAGNNFSGNATGTISNTANTNTGILDFGNLLDSAVAGALTYHPFIEGTRRQQVVDLDTTPDVSLGTKFRTTNSGATIITDFDGALYEGHKFSIVFDDPNTTIDFTQPNIRGNGGAAFAATRYDTMNCTYTNTSAGLIWICEISNN